MSEGEVLLSKCRHYETFLDTDESLEEYAIIVHNQSGEVLGTAFVVNDFSFQPEEYVTDYTWPSPMMERWRNDYKRALYSFRYNYQHI